MTAAALEARLRTAGVVHVSAVLSAVVSVRLTFPATALGPPTTFTGEGESIEAAVEDALRKAAA